MIETNIAGIFNGLQKSYIYIWISKTHKVVYVGMTNSETGVLGRASSHVSKAGTLRKRFDQYRGYKIEWVPDFIILSFDLPSKRIYYSLEKSYREAVEYLVQKELIKLRGMLNPTFDVISWVRHNPRTSNTEVIKISNSIVEKFKKHYNTL